MYLTRYTDYSIRLLMTLGLRDGGSMTISDISDAHGISRNHLVKIVNRLALLGIVHTARGRGGGVRLAADPGDIVIGRVVRSMEPTLGLAECFDRREGQSRENHCAISSACRFKPALERALDAFLAVLDGYTLADFLRDPVELEHALDGS